MGLYCPPQNKSEFWRSMHSCTFSDGGFDRRGAFSQQRHSSESRLSIGAADCELTILPGNEAVHG
jgi:hypothetical protein